MSNLSVRLAKYFMNRSGSEPTFDPKLPYSENINHKSYINGSQEEKDAILLNMAQAQYEDELELPVDIYFPHLDLKTLLKDKVVFDIGCFCGGKAVAYGERWGAKEVHGMDITEDFIRAADLFADTREDKSIKYKFYKGFGENIPIEDNTYDAIISWDVFEHVRSLEEVLKECHRILKPGGLLLAAFPSFYSFAESHLGFATSNPVIHWFFSADTLNEAYSQIINERGEKAYWYKSKSKEPWQKMGCGIGTNGNTYATLFKALKNVPNNGVKFINTPVGSRGLRARKSKLIRTVSKLVLQPLNRLPRIRNYISHRIVFELKK